MPFAFGGLYKPAPTAHRFAANGLDSRPASGTCALAFFFFSFLSGFRPKNSAVRFWGVSLLWLTSRLKFRRTVSGGSAFSALSRWLRGAIVLVGSGGFVVRGGGWFRRWGGAYVRRQASVRFCRAIRCGGSRCFRAACKCFTSTFGFSRIIWGARASVITSLRSAASMYMA